MSFATHRPLLLIVLAALLLSLTVVACGGASPTSNAPGGQIGDAPPLPASTGGDDGAAEKIKIKTPDDRLVVEFKPGGAENVKIEYGANEGAQVLRGELGKNDKRKYQLEGGGQIVEVKLGDDGFKVRTPAGALLWKVKISDDKIKISNNEENANPFVLSVKGDDRVKVLQNETEIGEVKFYRDRQKVKVKDAGEQELFESNTDHYSAMYGVLLMQQIPDPERYVIMAELLLRKR